MTVRRATTDDGDAIAALLDQLGYPTVTTEVPRRLQRLNATGSAVAFVAEEAGTIVGLATVHLLTVLNRPRDVAWLTTLVVDQQVRGRGIGRQLVDAVEAFARASNCERLSVSTHEDRSDARAFYHHLGLEPTGRRFGKMLK